MEGVKEVNSIIEERGYNVWENLFIKGSSYQNYATLIVIVTRGKVKTTVKCECGKDCSIEYEAGFHPWVVEAWKRLIKPMNVPVVELVISGHEVGEAYEEAINQLLSNPQLAGIKYVLFLEDDILIPFIPGTYGPLIELYKHLEKYDVASALYWTKSEPSLPLIYGQGDLNEDEPFAVNINWRPGDIVSVNGCGMGFTLMKRAVFEDARIERPFFKTFPTITQDLFFYKKIKELGYTICVDTNIRAGHLDILTERVF